MSDAKMKSSINDNPNIPNEKGSQEGIENSSAPGPVPGRKKKSKNRNTSGSDSGVGSNSSHNIKESGGPDESKNKTHGLDPKCVNSKGSFEDESSLGFDTVKHWKRHLPRSYSYFSLFRYSTRLDKLHLIIGSIAAIIGGICIPVIFYWLGKMVRSMVVIERIKKTLKCSSEICKNFTIQCEEATTIPKNASDADKINILNKNTTVVMEEFATWSLLTTLIYTMCSSTYLICWHIAADNQIGRLRRIYFEGLLRKDMTWFDTQKDPESVNRLMDHTRRIHEGMGESIPIAINLITIFILCTMMGFAFGWSLTILGLLSVFVIIATTMFASYFEAKIMVCAQNAYKIGNEFAEEVLTNARTMIFYGGQRKELIRYKKELNRDIGKVTKWITLHSASLFLLWTVNFCVWAVVIWYGMALVLFSQDCNTERSSYFIYDAGDMIIVVMCMIFGAGNIYLVIPVFHSMQVAVKYGRKVFQIIDGPKGIDNLDTEGIFLEPFRGEIEFQDVCFTYPTSQGGLALNHLHMHITGSSNVAIVGINGSGKSSIMKLISKEYLPDSGFIKFDGEDIRNINTSWLRSQIGFVPQDTNIFEDTIEANVRMGKSDAEFFEIQEACKRANAHDFIVSLKEAYQTRLGLNGFKLTPGQQQKISIARALVRNPKILLLDEPTSSLDSESEMMIMDTIEKVSKDRTVILVTHRLYNVTRYDTIFCLKRGKVAEKGNHSRLIKNEGPYSQLASGLFDRPSTSIKRTTPIKSFDKSEINAIYLMIIFGIQPTFPSIYNNRLTVNPVATHVSSRLMKQIVVSPRPLMSIYREPDERIFTLENNDSINEDDSLSNSEMYFNYEKQLLSAGDGIPKSSLGSIKVVIKSRDIIEVEGLKDIFDPYNYSFFQVLLLATKSSYKILILLALIGSLSIGLVPSIFAVFFSDAIKILSKVENIKVAGNWEQAATIGFKSDEKNKFIIIGLAFLGAFGGVGAALQNFCITLASHNMIIHIRKRLFEAFLKQDLSFFENSLNSVPIMRDMLSIDVISLKYMISGCYCMIPQAIVNISLAIVLGVTIYGSQLTGYTLLIAIYIAIINFIDSWLARKQRTVSMTAMTEISSLILQVFRGKHNVTIMQLEPFFLNKFSEAHNAALRQRRRISYIRAITFGLSQTSVFWGYSIFIYLAINEIVNHGRDFKDVIAIGHLLIFGLIQIGGNLAMITSFNVSIKAGKGILNVLNREPTVSPEKGIPVDDCDGALAFNDVHFWHSYSVGDNPLLKGITFEVQPGKTIGIAGSSESGKSMFLEIIMRMFEVPCGFITLDGHDIKDLNILSMRRQIGYVERQPQLFKRTVGENIAYGDNSKKITMTEIIDAGKKTNLHNLICSLPDGYDTLIGAENERLSLAQKQRITIARALLRNPKILLVDEATTNLDREGEKLVLESIDEARKDRTCIIIGHRLMTIQKADLIIMMKDGYIAESGKHEELVKNPNGDYGKLWRSQNPLQDEIFSKGKTSKDVPPPATPLPQLPEPKVRPKHDLEIRETGCM